MCTVSPLDSVFSGTLSVFIYLSALAGLRTTPGPLLDGVLCLMVL